MLGSLKTSPDGRQQYAQGLSGSVEKTCNPARPSNNSLHLCATNESGHLAPVFSGLGATGLGRAKGLFGTEAIGRVFAPLDLDGDPVVCLPNRDLLLVTGSENQDGIRGMLKHAEEIAQTKSRPMNPAPLILKDNEVADLSVRENSPIFNDVERAKKISALIYYQQQTGNLTKLYEQKGKDLFVSEYTLNQREMGGYESYCAWSKTVPSLLPKTDLIAFFDPTKPESQRSLGLAKWDKVLRIAGDLLLDTQTFFARFYVSKFSTEEQLAAVIQEQRFAEGVKKTP